MITVVLTCIAHAMGKRIGDPALPCKHIRVHVVLHAQVQTHTNTHVRSVSEGSFIIPGKHAKEEL